MDILFLFSSESDSNLMSHSWLSVPIDSNFLQSIAGNGDERLFLEQREMLVITTDYAGVMEAWA